MAQKYDVAGLGNAIVDIIASVDDRFLLTHKIAKGAMTLIDEFRVQELHKALADHAQALSISYEVAGGSCANTMAGLASLGARGLYVGKVYDDRLGSVFGASMLDLGVDFTTLRARTGSPTASCMIAVTPDGQRSMSTYLGACRELVPEDVDADAIAQAAVVYIEGYLWDEETAKQASRKAIAAAKAAGGRVALSLSDSFCVGRFRDEFLGLLQNDLNIIFANEDEAKALFEEETFEGVVARAKAWGRHRGADPFGQGLRHCRGRRGPRSARRAGPRSGGHHRRGRPVRGGFSLWPDAGTQSRRLRPAGRHRGGGSDLALWRAAGSEAEGVGTEGGAGLTLSPWAGSTRPSILTPAWMAGSRPAMVRNYSPIKCSTTSRRCGASRCSNT